MIQLVRTHGGHHGAPIECSSLTQEDEAKLEIAQNIVNGATVAEAWSTKEKINKNKFHFFLLSLRVG